MSAGGHGHRGARAAAVTAFLTRRDEPDLVHVDLERGPLLAFLAFPGADGQVALDNYRITLREPVLRRLGVGPETGTVVPVGNSPLVLPVANCDRELHAFGSAVAAIETKRFGIFPEVAHQRNLCKCHNRFLFLRRLARFASSACQLAGLARDSGSRSCPAIRFWRGHGGAFAEVSPPSRWLCRYSRPSRPAPLTKAPSYLRVTLYRPGFARTSVASQARSFSR